MDKSNPTNSWSGLLRLLLVRFCCNSTHRSEDANKSFSAAVQLHDSLVKAWALWGDYLDQLFANERSD